MRRVFGIGETVLDIIFKNHQPVAAKAGGSALNTLVSLARVDVPVNFITEIGRDKVGENIMQFLTDNKLNTDYICRFTEGKSALALAYLNDNNDAEYEFFKEYPKQRLVGNIPDFNENDIVIFGSYFGLNPAVRPRLLEYLKVAKDHGSLIIYDPNFRKHHLKNREKLIPIIEENFRIADIVRGSDEDFENIFNLNNPTEVYARVAAHCNNLIITAGSKGVYAFGTSYHHHFNVPIINPVSTIGAGDNFNAGIIKALLDFQILKKNNQLILTAADWVHITAYAIEFSSEVCMRIDNYVDVHFKSNFASKVERRIASSSN
ncbi:fructokinase [Carboxylicivirga sp. A043]|uniref:PfkB family carbohydrate kinase n=1 Tax=Carboxylicivirga litoralis TaxID=2816963 RepID=UPI0021CB77BE|nr:PfkB family carbohydrate kinase [Carboxylicivirga sp. A043]MCU4157577.1 fructokinase [Carboxylicivirga sp. A043]